MDAEELVELLQAYLLENNRLKDFLDYCEESGNDKEEVSDLIDKIVYGE
jgi:hypothetical protein